MHRRRPGTVSTPGIDEGEGVGTFTRARAKERDRYLHAAWPRVARDGTSTA